MRQISGPNRQRRQLLMQLGLLTATGLLPVSALARAKATQAAMQYQDAPKNGKRCADCMHFLPSQGDGQPGKCKVVKGDIAADGYCLAWAPKA